MFLQKKSGDTTDREFEEFREFEGRELEELDCIWSKVQKILLAFKIFGFFLIFCLKSVAILDFGS